MADISDVEKALVDFIGQDIYPIGSGSPSIFSGINVRIFRGFPLPAQLEIDIANQTTSITVFSKSGVTRNTTRFLPVWEDGPIQVAPMQVTLTNNNGNDIATFSGISAKNMVVGIRYKGIPYTVAMNAGEGPQLAATRLAALIPNASALGSSVVCPMSSGFLARISMPRISRRELRRVKQAFTVSTWAPSPEVRDEVGSRVDALMGAIDWILLSDGTGGRIQFVSQYIMDTTERSGVYRRDTEISVEYALYDQRLLPVVMFGIVACNHPSIFNAV